MAQVFDGSCSGVNSCFEPSFFKVLSDPTRLALFARLANGSGAQTVSEVASCCPNDLSVVSRHLSALRAAGLLESEKRGREVLYKVRYNELARTLRQMADAIDACCPPTETSKECC